MQRRISATLGEPVPVLIVGAGAAGMLLLQAMKQTSYRAVGFVDDDIAKQHIKFGGIPVVGRIDQLTALAKRYGAAEILIAVPSATGVQMIHITDACRQSGLPFRAVPSLSSLIVGKLNIAELHDVDLEDLLGRDPVLATPDMVNQRIEGRVVMVTGAAGSIGSELCRQLAGCNPRKLVCLDQAETPLFNLQQRGFPGSSVETVYAVGDITDSETMQQQILRHKVQVIFHAAAYKHVPMTEANPHEGLKNNVFGLLDLVEVAEECGCDDFVLVSSDKAVNPSSLMGCTKRLGEMIVGSRPSSRMRCISVRFGNVLGSQGSVVPVFQEQIRTTGVITVTHPEMTRYFMTIPEAASLVLQAFTVGEHGDILVLDMGKPVRIVDLARTLTRVLGKREDEVSIVFIGMRPGEKLFEELFYDSETIVPTALNKVMRAQTLLPCWNFLSAELLQLRAAAPRLGPDEVRAAIKHMIPEYEWQAPAGPVPVAAEAVGAAKFDPRNSAQVSVRPGKPSTALQHRTAAKRALNKKSYA
jgi:FlaA1/EpsC-like NDP-sugar epimerase